MNIQYLIYPKKPNISIKSNDPHLPGGSSDLSFPGAAAVAAGPPPAVAAPSRNAQGPVVGWADLFLFCNQLMKMVDEHQKNILGIQAHIFFSA